MRLVSFFSFFFKVRCSRHSGGRVYGWSSTEVAEPLASPHSPTLQQFFLFSLLGKNQKETTKKEQSKAGRSVYVSLYRRGSSCESADESIYPYTDPAVSAFYHLPTSRVWAPFHSGLSTP